MKGLIFAVFGFSLAVAAQRGPQPQLLECGTHDGLEVICGTQAPEDLELTPDGRYVLVTEFGAGGNFRLFDLENDSFADLAVSTAPDDEWGASGCGPMTEPISGHGTSLGPGPGGATALYVVNHGGRETVEMFELVEDGDTWELIWRGCATTDADYNDVAILPGGGFVATRPQALVSGRGAFGQAGPTGNIARWTETSGETILAGTQDAFPNGVVVDPDGRYMYFSAFTGRAVHKYDLEVGARVAGVDVDFNPDNLTWTPSGELLAAGISGFGGRGGDGPAFRVARVNPDTMEATTIYTPGEPPPITGVSVALQVDDAVYIGSFQGDRMVRIELD